MKTKLLAICLMLASLCGCASEKGSMPFDEYDKAEEILTEKKTSADKALIIDENKKLYGYEDMEKDLKALSVKYKDMTSLNVIGETLDGRDIYDLVIGEEEADDQIIIHASIHAREYITTKLVMKQLVYYLDSLKNDLGEYKGIAYSDLFDDVAIHVVPMVNPDGVTLAQFGYDGLKTRTAKRAVRDIVGEDISTYDFAQWKANANGVDLNRNYDAMWDEFEGAEKAAAERYKGTAPGSEPETEALISITEANNVVRTISYHTCGEVIYWYFGQRDRLYDESLAFVNEISEITGYEPDGNSGMLDPAGYKDWALEKMRIPSVTVEVGHGGNPVPDSQLEDIVNRNKDVWAGTLYNYKYGKDDLSDKESRAFMKVVNCDEWISLRVSPSKEAEKYTTIPLGETVELVSEAANGFYKVKYKGYIGYALSSYLEFE